MFRVRPVALVVLALSVTFAARTASAQDATPHRLDFSTGLTTAALLSATTAAPVRFGELEPMKPIVPIRPKTTFGSSKGLLPSLYASTAVMQGLDIHSTMMAFNSGAVEGNPLMSGATRNRAAFIATKAAVTAGTILLARKIAKKNKVAAVVTLVAVNSAYAMVVAHNYNLARQR
jgi:hypothetical protein